MAATRAQEDLVVRIRVDDARAGQKFKSLERNMNKFRGVNKKVAAGVKRTRDEFGKFSKTAKVATKATSSLSGGFGGIGMAALGILGPLATVTGAFFLLKSAIGSIIDAGRFAEDTITTLGVALGSEKAGVEAFKKAIDFSVVTPFDPREVAAATELAVSFGIKDPFQKGVDGLAKDVSLQQLASGIASFSRDKDIINAMKGILIPEKEIIKRWGGDVVALYDNIVARGIKLSSPKFQREWIGGLSRIVRFEQAAKEASKTVSGMMSTIGGNIGNIALFFTGAGEGKNATTFWNFFRSIINDVNVSFSKFMDKAGPVLIQIGSQVGGIFKDVFDIAIDLAKIAIPKIIFAIAPLLVQMAVVFAVFRGVLKVVKFILDFIVRFTVATGKWLAKVLGLNKLFKDTGDFFGGIITKAKGLLVVFNIIIA